MRGWGWVVCLRAELEAKGCPQARADLVLAPPHHQEILGPFPGHQQAQYRAPLLHRPQGQPRSPEGAPPTPGVSNLKSPVPAKSPSSFTQCSGPTGGREMLAEPPRTPPQASPSTRVCPASRTGAGPKRSIQGWPRVGLCTHKSGPECHLPRLLPRVARPGRGPGLLPDLSCACSLADSQASGPNLPSPVGLGTPSPHPVQPSSLRHLWGHEIGAFSPRGLTPHPKPRQPGDWRSWWPGQLPSWPAALRGYLPVSSRAGPQQTQASRGAPGWVPAHTLAPCLALCCAHPSWRAGPARGARSPTGGLRCPPLA